MELKYRPSAHQRFVSSGATCEGIESEGMLRLGCVLSFHVIFQAKRYKGSVSPTVVRNFRGAMFGRVEKGIVITTGTFTREAIKKA